MTREYEFGVEHQCGDQYATLVALRRPDDPTEGEALVGAIKKWETIATHIAVTLVPVNDGGVDTCPLCELHKRMDKRLGFHTYDCQSCVIGGSPGNEGCNKTPYHQYSMSFPDDPPLELLRWAVLEVDYLKAARSRLKPAHRKSKAEIVASLEHKSEYWRLIYPVVFKVTDWDELKVVGEFHNGTLGSQKSIPMLAALDWAIQKWGVIAAHPEKVDRPYAGCALCVRAEATGGCGSCPVVTLGGGDHSCESTPYVEYIADYSDPEVAHNELKFLVDLRRKWLKEEVRSILEAG